MNTRIHYLYTDAANYKTTNQAVIPGEITPEQQAQIFRSLDEEKFFIPRAIGLPEDRGPYQPDHELDHCWFSMEQSFAEPTDNAPTVNITGAELAAKFAAIGPDGWDAYVTEI